jgi:type I protein arginine methyltransferase
VHCSPVLCSPVLCSPVVLAHRKGCDAHRKGCDVDGTGKSEDFKELPIKGDKVDVLVSEWMGYALLLESMLDSVLHCRDRWLKPGGAMLPDVAILYVAAATEAAADLTFWRDVYGFDFSVIKDDLMSSAIAQPHVTAVGKGSLLSEPAKVKEFDLPTMRASDADFHADFELVASKSGDCRALVLWFDTLFTKRFCSDAPCVLSTSPLEKQTHWMQTVFVLRDAIPLSAGQKLCARCSFAKSGKHRSIDISFELERQGEDGKPGARVVQAYVMEVASDSSPRAPGR